MIAIVSSKTVFLHHLNFFPKIFPSEMFLRKFLHLRSSVYRSLSDHVPLYFFLQHPYCFPIYLFHFHMWVGELIFLLSHSIYEIKLLKHITTYLTATHMISTCMVHPLCWLWPKFHVAYSVLTIQKKTPINIGKANHFLFIFIISYHWT